MSIGTLFKRQYETPSEIEQMTVEDILRIPPNKISTRKIMAEEELFKAIDPTKQAAVKFIAEQKRMRDERRESYPTPDKMIRMFYTDIKEKIINKIDAEKILLEVATKEDDQANFNANITELTGDLNNINKIIDSLPKTSRKGGKKRSRKQRKQRRRKTRRSV